MADPIEIKTRLTLDNEASEELNRVKEGFKGTKSAAGDATSAVGSFASQVAATALANYLPRMIEQVKSLAFGFLESADAAYEQEQAVASMITIMQDVPWDEAEGKAHDLRREMEEFSTTSGVAFDDINAGFMVMVNTMGAASDQLEDAKQRTKDLTIVADQLNMSVAELGNEYAMMIEHGVVRMRSPLARMLATTGMFTSKVKEGVAAFKELNPEKRAELLSNNLGKIIPKLEKAAPTFGDVVTSLQNTAHLLQESFGTPIVKALIPIVQDLADEFQGLRPDIEILSELIAKDLVSGIKDGGTWLRNSVVYVKDHWDEIRKGAYSMWQDMKGAWQFAKDVMSFIVDNKETLAIMGGALAGAKFGGIGGAAVGLGAGLVLANTGGGVGAGSNLAGTAGAAGGVGVGAAVIGGASLPAAAALGGVAAAGYQFSQLYKEQWGSMSDEALDQLAKLEQAKSAFDKGDLQRAKEWAQEAQVLHDEGRGEAMAMLNAINQRDQEVADLERRIAQSSKTMQIEELIDAYNEAVLKGNVQLQKLAASTISSSEKFNKALDEGKLKIVGGIDSLREAASKSMEDFARTMKDIKDMAEGTGGSVLDAESGDPFKRAKELRAKGKAQLAKEAERRARQKSRDKDLGGTVVNVQKMEVHQNFRDEDPDRVVAIFKRELVNAAMRRVQSKRATIFGF